ncbi:unnamed protein product [Allacma fusca]|uniref:CRAL-TRIO domain-containing protein n=1 Tax=Allacma fusca TaxID=39272 RepID=A0A8J2L7Q3_9HEXA|nr:unnamed protein product [Allacma fusca]
MPKFLTIFFGIVSAACLIPRSLSQLTPEEVPPELRYVVESDLEEYEPPKELSETLPYYLSGFDFDNRPIWVVEFGKWDLRSYLEKGDKWEKLVDKYVDKFFWRLYESTQIKGTEELPVKSGVLIVDFDGLTYRQFSSPAALAFYFKKLRALVFALPFAQNVFAVNVNYASRNLLEIVRPIIGKDFHRVDIFGTNPNRYRPALLRVLPKNQLPQWYGGDKDFKPVKVYG